MSRLDTRLAAGARLAHAHGVDVEPFIWAFREVVEAIRESDSFLDVTVVDPATGMLRRSRTLPAVSGRIDAEVEASFARSLRDWAPRREAEILTRRLRGGLAVWRVD
jgi:hypothetical protein